MKGDFFFFFFVLVGVKQQNIGTKTKNIPCFRAFWQRICQVPEHWESKTSLMSYIAMTPQWIRTPLKLCLSVKLLTGEQVDLFDTRALLTKYWLEKRSSLFCLRSFHVGVPTFSIAPTPQTLYKNTPLSALMPHILISSLFFFYFFLFSYLQPLQEVVCLQNPVEELCWAATGPYYQSMTRSHSVNLSD